MFCVQLRSVNVSENGIEVCFVVSLEQESMLEAMRIKVLDDLRMVDREGRVRSHSDPKQGHVLGCDDLVLLGRDSVEQGLVEKLIADSDLLALVEGLEEMVQATVFESLLDFAHLILARRLELLEKRLDVVALLLQESFEEMSLGGL